MDTWTITVPIDSWTITVPMDTWMITVHMDDNFTHGCMDDNCAHRHMDDNCAHGHMDDNCAHGHIGFAYFVFRTLKSQNETRSFCKRVVCNSKSKAPCLIARAMRRAKHAGCPEHAHSALSATAPWVRPIGALLPSLLTLTAASEERRETREVRGAALRSQSLAGKEKLSIFCTGWTGSPGLRVGLECPTIRCSLELTAWPTPTCSFSGTVFQRSL